MSTRRILIACIADRMDVVPPIYAQTPPALRDGCDDRLHIGAKDSDRSVTEQ